MAHNTGDIPLIGPEADANETARVSSPGGTAERGAALGRQLGQAAVMAALIVASYLFTSHFILESVQVLGPSMMPTLHSSEHYLLNRWVYYLRPPRRGDVVVIRDPADRGLSVKRVVGLPGDSLSLKEGRVYVNGGRFEEAYLPVGVRTFPEGRLAEQTLLCGPDQYLVLGDNRLNSTDSRSYGPVPRRDVLGLITP